MIYEKILKPILFRFTDPEKIHHTVLEGMRVVSRQKTLYNYFYNICNIKDPRLKTKIGSVEFENPVGLAAGFEKYIRAPLAVLNPATQNLASGEFPKTRDSSFITDFQMMGLSKLLNTFQNFLFILFPTD